MGSRQTFENHPAVTLIQGKLGEAGRLLNLEPCFSGETLKKKEPSTEDGKPSSERGLWDQPRSSHCFH